MSKNTKQVSITVNKKIWDSFVKKVESIEGTTYAKIGPTLTGLIEKHYLSNSDVDVYADRLNKLKEELSDKTTCIDNILLEKKQLTKENSEYVERIQKLENNLKQLTADINQLTRDYESTLEDNQKYDELLYNLEDKVLKLSDENQILTEKVNNKSEENNEIYMKALKNEEKLKNLNSKYKYRIRKLTTDKKILEKECRYLNINKKRRYNSLKDKQSTNNKNNMENSENDLILDNDMSVNQQLQRQYDEYMKQFENIKRK